METSGTGSGRAPWRLGHRQVVLFAATGFVFADLVLIWIGLSADFAFDFTCCYQQAADRAIHDPSSLYVWSATYTFRYTPLGAVPFVPLIGLAPLAAAWAWTVLKVGVLVVVAVWLSRPWPRSDRWLVALAVMTFPPVVHDLVIGNVSTLTLLVLLATARWRDARGGVVIGLLTVLMPKPHLIPVLGYLAFRRPRQFMAAMATVVAGLVGGVAIFGIDPWIAYLGTLREPLERTFTANIGWSGLLGPAGVVVGVVVAAVIFVIGVRIGGSRGYGMSILAGIVAGPYTFIHYLAGTLVAVEPVLWRRPRWLSPFPWLLVAFPFVPIWLTGLAGVLALAPGQTAEAEPPTAEQDSP
jgi:hypothetical protein